MAFGAPVLATAWPVGGKWFRFCRQSVRRALTPGNTRSAAASMPRAARCGRESFAHDYADCYAVTRPVTGIDVWKMGPSHLLRRCICVRKGIIGRLCLLLLRRYAFSVSRNYAVKVRSNIHTGAENTWNSVGA